MALTLRNVKGSRLTFTELDGNFTYLQGLDVSGASYDIGTDILTLSLYNGGTITASIPTTIFTGNTAATCINALWVENISGCTGPVTIGTSIQSPTSIVSGDYSVAYGQSTLATGTTSHAEGSYTEAHGDSAHAEGRTAKAYGDFSHAEGHRQTIASGETSHAEGHAESINWGYISHAEGYDTRSLGEVSHAEGYGTVASGIHGSHAEGRQTLASGNYSHSEGLSTSATTAGAHAAGYKTLASGEYSQAGGYLSISSGDYSIAYGSGTTASGRFAHTLGTDNTASGLCSHAEGDQNTASGENSHAEGYLTEATDFAAHAEGWLSSATGQFSHAEGYNCSADGNGAHAEGNNSIASTGGDHAEGSTTTASGGAAHAEGTLTLASGQYSHAEGQSTIASYPFSHAQGFSTQASGYGSHAGGRAFGNVPFVGYNRITAAGDASFIHFRKTLTGGTTGAYGDYSAILGGINQNINTGAHSSGIFVGSANTINTNVERSVILGGGMITGTTNDTVYVPNLNIDSTPANDNALTQILARNTDGTIKYRDASSLGGGGGGTFTGNTSGTCIEDIWVTNIQSCSPLYINPGDEGNVYFGSSNGVTINVADERVGIGTAGSTNYKLWVKESSTHVQGKIESDFGYARWIIDSQGNNDSILQFNEANDRRWQIASDGGDDSLKILRQDITTGGTIYPAVIIDPTDNVGIGVGPSYKLDVKIDEEVAIGVATTILNLTHDVGTDLNQQKLLIAFNLEDANLNGIPQVKIGAEVGENGDCRVTNKRR